MGKKLSITELTDNLEKMSEESLEKAEEEEVETEETTEETEPTNEEETVEEEETKEESPKGEAKEEEEETTKEEVITKSEEEETKECTGGTSTCKADNCEKCETKEEPENTTEEETTEEDTTEEDTVTKSEHKENTESTISNQDFVGAFEAIIKSYGGVVEQNKKLIDKVDSLQKSITSMEATIDEMKVEPKEEHLSKSETETETETETEEEVEVEGTEDELNKSEEEIPEGKAVDYIEKSEEETEEAEEEPFNPLDHVKTVVDYFTKNQESLSQGDKAELRGAVSRVKGGREFQKDISLFEEIANKVEN